MNLLAYAEAAGAALVVAWLVAALFAHPVAFGVVVLFALLPLALVVLPLFAVRALSEGAVTLGRSSRDRRIARTARDRIGVASRPPRADPSATEAENGAD